MIIQCKCKCGTEFEEYNKWGRKREFVRGHNERGKSRSDVTRQLISIATSGENHPMYGKHHSPKSKQLMSDANSGEKHPLFGKHPSDATRQLMSEKQSGEKNYNWQGGISKELYCQEWDIWLKKEIKERDDFQCQNPDCDSKVIKNNPLCVHHIDYDKKNCSTNNLITLCKSCNAKANFNRKYWQELYERLFC